MKIGIFCGAVVLVALSANAVAGGELPAVQPAAQPCVQPSPQACEPKVTLPAFTPVVSRDVPLPAPRRRIGCSENEFYGPTYYYPSYHNYYQGLNPTYYPFYHPRLWPNYRSEPTYTYRSGIFGNCQSQAPYWDDYDDWVRGGRYEEHQ